MTYATCDRVKAGAIQTTGFVQRSDGKIKTVLKGHMYYLKTVPWIIIGSIKVSLLQ